MIVFPIIVASVIERLGEDFKRIPYLKRRDFQAVGGT
jgi:hypothetical protein